MFTRKTRILLADNNRELCEVITDYLSIQKDMEVIGSVYDGQAALEFIKQHRPDVILLDISMPKLDGIGVMENLSELPYEPDVIVLTAFEQESIIGNIATKRASYYMVKPVDLAALVRIIQELPRVKKENNDCGAVKIEDNNVVVHDLEAKVSETFYRLGVPAHFRGYSYLRDAIVLAVQNEKTLRNILKNIYPKIARKYGATIRSVESAMRYTIITSWERGNQDCFQEIFGIGRSSSVEDEIPTISVFIAKIANLIHYK